MSLDPDLLDVQSIKQIQLKVCLFVFDLVHNIVHRQVQNYSQCVCVFKPGCLLGTRSKSTKKLACQRLVAVARVRRQEVGRDLFVFPLVLTGFHLQLKCQCGYVGIADFKNAMDGVFDVIDRLEAQVEFLTDGMQELRKEVAALRMVYLIMNILISITSLQDRSMAPQLLALQPPQQPTLMAITTTTATSSTVSTSQAKQHLQQPWSTETSTTTTSATTVSAMQAGQQVTKKQVPPKRHELQLRRNSAGPCSVCIRMLGDMPFKEKQKRACRTRRVCPGFKFLFF